MTDKVKVERPEPPRDVVSHQAPLPKGIAWAPGTHMGSREAVRAGELARDSERLDWCFKHFFSVSVNAGGSHALDYQPIDRAELDDLIERERAVLNGTAVPTPQECSDGA